MRQLMRRSAVAVLVAFLCAAGAGFTGGRLAVSPATAAACCKICTKGCACGDSCISCDKVCHKGPGCACNGR
jgi:hypothetical protein